MHTFLQPIWDISAENHCHRKYENKLTSLHDQIKFVLNGQKAPGRVRWRSGGVPAGKIFDKFLAYYTAIQATAYSNICFLIFRIYAGLDFKNVVLRIINN